MKPPKHFYQPEKQTVFSSISFILGLIYTLKSYLNHNTDERTKKTMNYIELKLQLKVLLFH